MQTTTSIAVIEDEATIASSIAKRLRAEGYTVDVAHDGPSGVDLCERVQPDLVVLDVMLPGFDGFEVCRRIQRHRAVPVLMLTARDDETDLLVGLGVGADDYLTKPFSMRELVARIAVLLRRVDRGPVVPGDAITIADLVVDAQRRQVTVDGAAVHLTVTEFDLLLHLVRRPGVVLPREHLLREVWGYRDGSSTRTVDSHVAALRRKIGSARIRTSHGVGYAFTEPG